jgi:hypothetical protein
MTYCLTYLETFCFSRYGLDPDTPPTDYQIHFVHAKDPAYIPPDCEAWPLYYQALLNALQPFPEVLSAVRAGVQQIADVIRGRRALPPNFTPRHFPHPNG